MGNEICAGSNFSDEIQSQGIIAKLDPRREVFDVSVTIENPIIDLAPSHEFNPMVVGELNRGSRNLQEANQNSENPEARHNNEVL